MSQSTDKSAHPQTPDSYDAHIIPAETAARKDREGDNYKQLPDENHNGSDPIPGGHTVDQEGLTNNYATEPEMYFDTPGDAPVHTTSSSDKYTIVDVFPSASAAENVVVKMKEAGLSRRKISILGKDYQDTEHVHGSLNWKDIDHAHGLAAVLEKLGIAPSEASKYELEVNSGKFVMLVTGKDEDIAQANQILHTIGHKTLAETSL